VQVNILQWYYK